MDYDFKVQEWTHDRADSNLGFLDGYLEKFDPSFPIVYSYNGDYSDSTFESLPDSTLESFLSSLSDSAPESLSISFPTVPSTPVPLPKRVSHSRGRRASKEESPKRKHACTHPECTDSFTRPEHLRRHLRAHKGEKLFACQECGKSFTRADNMNTHKRKVHRGC